MHMQMSKVKILTSKNRVFLILGDYIFILMLSNEMKRKGRGEGNEKRKESEK